MCSAATCFRLAGRPLRVHLSQDIGYDVYDRCTSRASAWRPWANDKDSLEADPALSILKRDDYRLRPDSPAYTLGFETCPSTRM
jgi:hypothetical protein